MKESTIRVQGEIKILVDIEINRIQDSNSNKPSPMIEKINRALDEAKVMKDYASRTKTEMIEFIAALTIIAQAMTDEIADKQYGSF